MERSLLGQKRAGKLPHAPGCRKVYESDLYRPRGTGRVDVCRTAAILRRWYVGHDAARGKDWSRAGDDQGDRQASPPRVSAPPFQRKPVPRITPTIDNPSCVPLGELDAVLNIITSTVAEHKAIAVDKAEEGCDTLSEAAAHAMDMFIVHEGCVTRELEKLPEE
mgnify:CR=1 FL=1